ncbi:MAG TPA: RNA polymerase sigma factor, partial [Terriglobia bacterium]|nr:RNA polymerase sigma factor [Terriglobia bacterium]
MEALADEVAQIAVASSNEAEGEFERLLPDSARLAFRVAFTVLRNREDAEDTAQETLLRAHRHFASLRDRQRFRAWVVRTTWRLAIDRQRSAGRRHRRELLAVDSQTAVTTEDLASSAEFERRLFSEMERLPEKLRVVLALAGVEGYDTREVARLLEIP